MLTRGSGSRRKEKRAQPQRILALGGRREQPAEGRQILLDVAPNLRTETLEKF